MIERTLKIGRWLVDFLFAVSGYDEEGVLVRLYDIGATPRVMRRASTIMESGKKNRGFTFANENLRQAVIVIGPTTDGYEFQNTLVHEIHHLAVAIASSLGIDLEGETPAYIAGDTAMDLAEVICRFGCRECNCG